MSTTADGRFGGAARRCPRPASSQVGGDDDEANDDAAGDADYLEGYAAAFALPARLETDVRRLEPIHDGYRATLSDGAAIEARAVVIASGAYQLPAISR